VAFAAILSMTAPCEAKKRHFEQLRAVLVLKAARCTSCHASEDGAGLNAYGRRLADFPESEPIAERVAALEPLAAPPEAAAEAPLDTDTDIDGDGVANGVEILAGANPADRESTPNRSSRNRVETVVSCRICHTATNLPGEGLKANPHNDLGQLLSRTFAPSRDAPKPKGDAEIREAAQRTPIIRRLALIRKNRPRGAAATYWESLRLLHPPADTADQPSRETVRAFRKSAFGRRKDRKRPDFMGKKCPTEQIDGLLKDAGPLD
jgi:hypothetical protein